MGARYLVELALFGTGMASWGGGSGSSALACGCCIFSQSGAIYLDAALQTHKVRILTTMWRVLPRCIKKRSVLRCEVMPFGGNAWVVGWLRNWPVPFGSGG